MIRCYKGQSFKSSKWDDPIHNPHRQDEMPKNMPSKLIQLHCPWIKVDWLQDSTSFGGHSEEMAADLNVTIIALRKHNTQ